MKTEFVAVFLYFWFIILVSSNLIQTYIDAVKFSMKPYINITLLSISLENKILNWAYMPYIESNNVDVGLKEKREDLEISQSLLGPFDFNLNDFDTNFHIGESMVREKREAYVAPHVLMVFFTSMGAKFKNLVGSPVQFNRKIWATVYPELKEFCNKFTHHDKSFRMTQLLGISKTFI
jgi:hypothetical protein